MATLPILLIDDNPDDLLALETILGRLEVTLVKVTSGALALRKVLTQDFVVIVLDIHLSDMNGIDVASLIRLRPRSSNIPIIFTSAFSNEEIMRRYRLAQNNLDFVSKPFDADKLIKKVVFFMGSVQAGQSG